MVFQEVIFVGCRLLGVVWEDCKFLLLQFWFEKCQFDYGVFGVLLMEGIVFLDCLVWEVDFIGILFKGVDFSGIDLMDVCFENV